MLNLNVIGSWNPSFSDSRCVASVLESTRDELKWDLLGLLRYTIKSSVVVVYHAALRPIPSHEGSEPGAGYLSLLRSSF
jgi:hypothetical protein